QRGSWSRSSKRRSGATTGPRGPSTSSPSSRATRVTHASSWCCRSAADADPTEAERPDRAGADQRLLERLGRRTAEPPVEVRTPLEATLLEPGGELAPEDVRAVQIDVRVLPAGQA